MYICFEKVDKYLIYIPENCPWSISVDYGGLCLHFDGKDILIMDVDYYCTGRPDLPTYAVESLYSDIIDEIVKLLPELTNKSVINIDEIEEKLLTETYFDKWKERGFITPDEKGVW